MLVVFLICSRVFVWGTTHMRVCTHNARPIRLVAAATTSTIYTLRVHIIILRCGACLANPTSTFPQLRWQQQRTPQSRLPLNALQKEAPTPTSSEGKAHQEDRQRLLHNCSWQKRIKTQSSRPHATWKRTLALRGPRLLCAAYRHDTYALRR